MSDKNKLNEYENKLRISLNKIDDYIRSLFINRALMCNQIMGGNNCNQTFELKIFRRIPLSISYGVCYGFENNCGYYEISVKLDNKIIDSKKFEINYDLIDTNKNKYFSINDLIDSSLFYIYRYIDKVLY